MAEQKHQCAATVTRPGYASTTPCKVVAKYREKDSAGEPQWWCAHHAPSKVKAKNKERQERFHNRETLREERYYAAVERSHRIYELLGVEAGVEYNRDWAIGATGGVAISADNADKLIETVERLILYSAWRPDVPTAATA